MKSGFSFISKAYILIAIVATSAAITPLIMQVVESQPELVGLSEQHISLVATAYMISLFTTSTNFRSAIPKVF